MEIHLIWAQDSNGGIGANGKLPWHVAEDLINFKSLTINSTVIMGRKTWESLPIKPLPKRNNIVLSSKKQDNVETYHSFEDCLDICKKKRLNKIFIIGGRSIYNLFFKYADFLHITNIHLENLNINEFFPISDKIINKKFNKCSEKKLSNSATYSFWVKNNY